MVYPPLDDFIDEHCLKGMSIYAGSCLYWMNRKEHAFQEEVMEVLPTDPYMLFQLGNPSPSAMTHEQVFFGYLPPETQQKGTRVYADAGGRILLPGKGSLFTSLRDEYADLNWDLESGSYRLSSNDQSIELKFVPVRQLEGTEIDVVEYLDPVLENLFQSGSKVIPVVVSNAIDRYPLQEAIDFIGEYHPRIRELIDFVGRRLMVFDSETKRSFASLETLGLAYINAAFDPDKGKMLYFADEIIHQMGHNIFFGVTFRTPDWFTINPYKTTVADIAPETKDRREVISVFHGLFTLMSLADFYDAVLERSTDFEPAILHEVKGRLVDNVKRLRKNWSKAGLSGVYTEKGQKLYELFGGFLEAITEKRADLIGNINTDTQPYYQDPALPSIFNYEVFLESNPL